MNRNNMSTILTFGMAMSMTGAYRRTYGDPRVVLPGKNHKANPEAKKKRKQAKESRRKNRR